MDTFEAIQIKVHEEIQCLNLQTRATSSRTVLLFSNQKRHLNHSRLHKKKTEALTLRRRYFSSIALRLRFFFGGWWSSKMPLFSASTVKYLEEEAYQQNSNRKGEYIIFGHFLEIHSCLKSLLWSNPER
jgi:hypothetical protein